MENEYLITNTKKYLFQSASILSIPQVKIGEGTDFLLLGKSVLK